MALTKVSRGLLSTGIVDNSNATAITLNSDESATFTSSVTATSLIASNGVLELDDNGSHNGVINVPASLFINIDSDNGNTGEDFVIAKDRTSTSGGTELFRVQEDGNVGIGTTPTRTFHSLGGSGISTVAKFEGGASSGSTAYVQFSSNGQSDLDSGYIGYDSSKNLTLWTDNTRAITIDGSQNLLVGTTSTNFNTAGTVLYGANGVQMVRSNATPLNLNRTTSDGAILEFYKDGTAIGSIDTHSAVVQFGQGNVNLAFENATDQVYPVNDNGTNNNGDIDLGKSNARFKDLYLSGGVNFNGSSGGINTANRSFLMDEYEIGTCTIGFNTANGDASLSRLDNVTGFYQKTGDICTVQFYSGGMTFSAAGSGSARVTGLPFNSRGGTYNYGACSVTHNSLTTTDIQNGYTAPNNNFIILTQRHTTSGAVFRTSGVRYFMFSITYLTQ